MHYKNNYFIQLVSCWNDRKMSLSGKNLLFHLITDMYWRSRDWLHQSWNWLNCKMVRDSESWDWKPQFQVPLQVIVHFCKSKTIYCPCRKRSVILPKPQYFYSLIFDNHCMIISFSCDRTHTTGVFAAKAQGRPELGHLQWDDAHNHCFSGRQRQHCHSVSPTVHLDLNLFTFLLPSVGDSYIV